MPIVKTMAEGSSLLRLVALFVIAPIGAAVVISALLLFGATPHLVFLPGFFVRARMEALGFHAPNAVGVLTTLVCWWAIIVLIWLVVRKVFPRST
jgi:hypothetical protein